MTADSVETYPAAAENKGYMTGGGRDAMMSGSSTHASKNSGWEYAGKYDPTRAHWDFGESGGNTGVGDVGFTFLDQN